MRDRRRQARGALLTGLVLFALLQLGLIGLAGIGFHLRRRFARR